MSSDVSKKDWPKEFGCYGSIAALGKDHLSVVNCSSCEFAHLLSNTVDERYYTDDHFYSEHSPDGWLDKEIAEYRGGWWNAAYRYQKSLFNLAFPLVDVGCGTGTFMDYYLNHSNVTVAGIEPSKTARNKAVVPGRYLYQSAPLSPYPDMNVRMSLVLEHIKNPDEFIERYKEYLGNFGEMLIIVPNEFNPLQKKVGGNWFVSHVHRNYFTLETLTKLLNRHGLEVVHASATFPTELFILVGLDHRGNDELGKKLHKARLVFERVLGVSAFRLYKKLFDKYGWGRELIVVAKHA